MGVTGAFAQQDSLIMNTGEILVGDIKGFDEGVVVIETDYSDNDFNVEWDKVKAIYTDQKFVIIASNGSRYFGKIISQKEKQSLVEIKEVDGSVFVLNIEDIVFFQKVEDTFWKRIDLSLSAGYSLAKANNSQQGSAHFKTSYLTSRIKYDLYGSLVRSVQTTEDITARISRTEGGIGLLMFIVNDWFTIVRSDLLQSSEQKLNIRSITKGGIGHYVLKNNSMNLGFAIGGDWNYEDYNDQIITDRNSVEVFAALEYKIFDLGDLDLLTRVVAYPSITEKDRFRTDFDFSLKYEFPFDLFIKLAYTLNYDNQPVEGGASTDYLLQTTIGWEL